MLAGVKLYGAVELRLTNSFCFTEATFFSPDASLSISVTDKDADALSRSSKLKGQSHIGKCTY